MSDAHEKPDLDALVRVIESLKERIKRDHETIGSNEIRTRTALIDPLLNALGWDTTNPAMVIPEYAAGDGVADYALLKVTQGGNTQPIAFIEAKRMNEDLRAHRAQMLTYSNMTGVKYAGLTNGDRWELYDVFKEAPLEDRRIINVSVRRQSAVDCAIQLLPLKWPYLETGEALSARGAQRLLSLALKANAAPSVVELLIDRGASLGVWNEHGVTPLHFVAQECMNPRVIELLLDRGADIAAKLTKGAMPLHLAAAHNIEPSMLLALLDQGADIVATDNDGWTPLHYTAAFNAKSMIIATLLNRGADITVADDDGLTPLHAAAAHNPVAAVLALLLDRGADIEATDNDGWTPLHTAANGNSNPEVVALLLDRGADIEAMDGEYRTPMALALCYNSSPEVIALLLDCGADITVDTGDLTMLHWAALYNPSTEVIALLLDRGVDVAATTPAGKTPLHCAARGNSNTDVSALLLDRGADLAATDDDGWTPLHCAVTYNSEPAVTELLLGRGADVTAADNDGRTPRQLAEEHGAANRVLWLLREPEENLLDEDFWREAEAVDVQAQLGRGVNINERDRAGRTLLHRAAALNRDPAVVKALLDNGANLHAVTNAWQTPYELAGRRGASEEVLRLLRG